MKGIGVVGGTVTGAAGVLFRFVIILILLLQSYHHMELLGTSAGRAMKGAGIVGGTVTGIAGKPFRPSGFQEDTRLFAKL